jgi:phage/plasmid-like protein (TIGR03299 family)
MSAETMKDLNLWTLIGNTDKRGTAWHYRADLQGERSNHYPGPIPVGDVDERLFYWKPKIGRMQTRVTLDGRSRVLEVPHLKSYVHPETGKVLGVVGKGAAYHGYHEFLVANTRGLQKVPELGIGSAGLLQGGAVAWLQIELNETIMGPGEVEFRPFYSATAVFDGSMSTVYWRGDQLIVCDNTRAAALAAAGSADMIRVPHRAGSLDKDFLKELREEVTALYTQANLAKKEIDRLLSTRVSDKEWEAFLVAHLGERPKLTIGSGKAALTKWENNHDGLTAMYRKDPRCKAWTGTEFGALQAVSTWNHHNRMVKGMPRAQRNMFNMATGVWAKEDAEVKAKLELVLAA